LASGFGVNSVRFVDRTNETPDPRQLDQSTYPGACFASAVAFTLENLGYFVSSRSPAERISAFACNANDLVSMPQKHFSHEPGSRTDVGNQSFRRQSHIQTQAGIPQ